MNDTMEIIYKRDTSCTVKHVEELFLSVDWISGKYPEKVNRALDNLEPPFRKMSIEKTFGSC